MILKGQSRKELLFWVFSGRNGFGNAYANEHGNGFVVAAELQVVK